METSYQRAPLWASSLRFMTGVFVLSATVPPVGLAQVTSYTDVPVGAYYEDAAAALLDLGALDSGEARLRPSDLATRAELVKLMVNLRDEPLNSPAVASFIDVSKTAWYYPYFETAARAGWVHGDNNCFGTRPCTARPASRVNRAEAAALLVRVFALNRTNLAPDFLDNSDAGVWYYSPIQAAADHCVLQGDDVTGKVRPAADMNRAEMIVMFHRASQNLQYGNDCGEPSEDLGISSVSVLSSQRVRITFDTALNRTRAEDESRYTIARLSGGGTVSVDSATLVSSNVVELDLSIPLTGNVSYALAVNGELSTSGQTFSDSTTFTFPVAATATITAVTSLSSRLLRVTFDTDLNATAAGQAFRYVILRQGGGSNITTSTATMINNRTVDLALSDDLVTNTQYTLSVLDLMTSGGADFSDTQTFTVAASAGRVVSFAPVTGVRARVTFDTAVDSTRAAETSRYSVSDGSHTLPILQAQPITGTIVELVFGESLQTQRAYTVNVNGMVTTQGAVFNGSGSFVYSSGTGSTINFIATLDGAHEVPSVTTAATGTGTFMLQSDGLHYDVTVRGMTGTGGITGAHFHLGAVGANGPVIMPISFTGNRSVGVWTNLSNEHRNALVTGNVYVNVHSTQYPNGQIRGQVVVN